MIGCLRTRVSKQPIIALYFERVRKQPIIAFDLEFETILKFHNLGALCLNVAVTVSEI